VHNLHNTIKQLAKKPLALCNPTPNTGAPAVSFNRFETGQAQCQLDKEGSVCSGPFL
jgi:hypothetical protein